MIDDAMDIEERSAGTAPLRVDTIVAATRTLFLRYGYRRTSVDDIAREAGVAKATLYAHFAGKEDMFRTMIQRCGEEVKSRCAAAEHMDAPLADRLVALLYAYYGTALEWFGDAAHFNELKLFAQENPIGSAEHHESEFQQHLRRVLLEAGLRGELLFEGRAGADAVVRTLILAAHGAKLAQLDGPQGLRRDLRAIVDVVFAGLIPKPGDGALPARHRLA